MVCSECKQWFNGGISGRNCYHCGAITGVRQPKARDVERMLRSLLAVIHRDGGHYAYEHGLEKATADAMQLSSERLQRTETSEAD